ncbi:helix-turn-helix domain-containing protein [Kitasatospora sp. NPDC058032]|uniref:helix-turn-helix domain-containing protein n=1 Tax=Kitasatospora sp. NPDC058032 TaxID=3346307 RepID=UPI0036DCC47F
MQVHRSAHARNFIVLPNAAMQDRRLSFTARGLLADLLSRPNNWREDARQMADTSTQSRAAIRKALKELIEAGYYRVEKVRLPDGTIRSEAHVYDTPQIPGLREAEEPLEAVTPQVEPSVPRPASGSPDSGAGGVLCVKNLVKEPSLPSPEAPPKAPAEPQPEAAGGQVGISVEDLDKPLQVAARVLQQALDGQRRMRLGEAEVVELAPLVVDWLSAGIGPAELAAALLPGLPETIHSPVGVVRSRLLRKLPMRPVRAGRAAADGMIECDECRDPVSRPGRCGRCAGRPGPVSAIGSDARITAAGAARARAAMRPRR